MAATNYTPIQLYYSTTASAAPTAGNLVNGELAINITDGKLYYKDNGGNVQVIATKGAGTIGGSNTQIQFNDGGALAGNAAMVFNKSTNVTTLTTLNLTNALGATYGGTAQSAYAQGDLLYASAVNTLSKLTIGTVNYILTSTGSVPQWVAPTSVTVQTANNLAGGAAGSVPYQSAPDTTTFLSIGAANRVMTSSGTAPQWVTALTGLTGVSSSSITNTSLTSGRLVYSSTGGLEVDSANLTFDGTTLSATGLSTTGFSTQVKTVTIGNSNFNGSAVFAPTTPAKLYIGTGTVTDVTSAANATNTTGAITAFGITPIAATNTSVTYTNASTLYIAGAPTAGTNVTITNPYSLYVAAGAAYFGGGLTFAGALNITDTTDATSTTTGSIKTAGGVGIAKSLWVGLDANIYGITVGRGAGAVSTNTAVGASALAANTTGAQNAAFGWTAGQALTTGTYSTALGSRALAATTTGNANTAVGTESLYSNTTVSNNTAVGYQAGYSNTTGHVAAAVGTKVLYANTTGVRNVALGGEQAGVQSGALASNTTGSDNIALGVGALSNNTTASDNIAVGTNSLAANVTGTALVAMGRSALTQNTGSYNTAIGKDSLFSNTTANNNTAVGYQAGYSTTTTGNNTFVGHAAGYGSTGTNNIGIGQASMYGSGDNNVAVGNAVLNANTTGSSNAGLGHNALVSNTTGGANTAVGRAALQSNTTASNNTAVGYQAGYNNITGADLTAVGQAAGFNNTVSGNTAVGKGAMLGANGSITGTDNVAVGKQALYSVTSGTRIVAVGSGALFSNTTGNYSVAIGQAALTNNTTGSNVAIGDSVMANNSTGNNNVAIGTFDGSTLPALYGNTTGYSNIAIGAGALRSNTTAAYNVGIGHAAGFTNSTSQYNTFVGGFAGQYTTGGYNTFIGYGAGYSVTSGTKNTILGQYSGNQGGLDIRTSSNYIVLSDGDGNPRQVYNSTGGTGLGAAPLNAASIRGYELGTGGAAYHGNGSRSYLTANAYWNDVQWSRVAALPAVQIVMDHTSGSFIVGSAATGTAGSAVSWNNIIQVNKDTTLALQGGTAGLSGTGITFPASQSASSDANTLDDYEEGSWTPVLYFNGVNSSSTYYDQYGTYTKIGNQVFIRFGIRVNVLGAGGSSSDGAQIYGLPFTNYGVSYADAVGQLGGDCFSSTDSGIANVANNAAWFSIRSGNGVTNNVVKSNFGNNKFVFGSFFYNVS